MLGRELSSAERPNRSPPAEEEGKVRNTDPLYLPSVWVFVHCGYFALILIFKNIAVKHYFSGSSSFLEAGWRAWLSSPRFQPCGSHALSPGATLPTLWASGLSARHAGDLPGPPAGEDVFWSGSLCPPDHITTVKRSFLEIQAVFSGVIR